MEGPRWIWVAQFENVVGGTDAMVVLYHRQLPVDGKH